MTSDNRCQIWSSVDLKRAQHIAHCGPRRRYRRQPVTGAKAGRTLPTSERRIPRDGDPMHATALAGVIVKRAVLGAAVVPQIASEPTSQRNRQVNSG